MVAPLRSSAMLATPLRVPVPPTPSTWTGVALPLVRQFGVEDPVAELAVDSHSPSSPPRPR